MDVASHKSKKQDGRALLRLSKPHFHFQPTAIVRNAKSTETCKVPMSTAFNISLPEQQHDDGQTYHYRFPKSRVSFPSVSKGTPIFQNAQHRSPEHHWESASVSQSNVRARSAPKLGKCSTGKAVITRRRPASVGDPLGTEADTDSTLCLSRDFRRCVSKMTIKQHAWTRTESTCDPYVVAGDVRQEEDVHFTPSQHSRHSDIETDTYIKEVNENLNKAPKQSQHKNLESLIAPPSAINTRSTEKCKILISRAIDVDTNDESRPFLSDGQNHNANEKIVFSGAICPRTVRFSDAISSEQITYSKPSIVHTDTHQSVILEELAKQEKQVIHNIKDTNRSNSNGITRNNKCQKQVLKYLKYSMQRKKGRKIEANAHVNEAIQLFEQQMDLTEPTREHEKESRKISFVKAAMFVRYNVRIMACMVDLSVTLTSRSATEEQWHALNTSKGARDMAFNKAAFAKKKDHMKVPKWARQILNKCPDERSEKDLRRLHALLRGLKSFDKFTEKIQLSMCRSFTYHSVKPGRIILRQGHVGINFYFVYSGSVFVNIDDTDNHGNRFTKTEVVLWRGDSFGELALLQDIRRQATITVREECELLVVDKDTFAKVCPRIFERELEEKVKFLSRLPIFGSRILPLESLKKLCFEAQILEYKTNKIIVEDSTKEDWIHVCMEGKCEVIQKFDIEAEIERRLNGSLKTTRKQSVAYAGNDVIELLGLLGNRRKSIDGGVSGRPTGSAGVTEGKQSLLESMELEYKRRRQASAPDISHKRPRVGSNSEILPTRTPIEPTSSISTNHQMSLTLTSLLSRDKENGAKHLFLSIRILRPQEIFDVSNMLGGNTSTGNGSYILVSSGARVLRLKRASYVRYATPAGVQLAKTQIKRERYPSADVLLRCYRDFLKWDAFKKTVLNETVKKIKKQRDGSARYEEIVDEHNRTVISLTLAVGDDPSSVKQRTMWEKTQLLSQNNGADSNLMTVNSDTKMECDLLNGVSVQPMDTSAISRASDIIKRRGSGDGSTISRLPVIMSRHCQWNQSGGKHYETIAEADEGSAVL